MNYSWTCPFCKQLTTIVPNNEIISRVDCEIKSESGSVGLVTKYIICPNPKCNKLTLKVNLFTLAGPAYNRIVGKLIKKWELIPDSTAKIYSPEIVPQAIIKDYEEACKIKNLSPKASATLSRRALQGMVRDFWDVKDKPNLKQEIEEIEEKVDADVWSAIDAVRSVGNIGAHMEKDVNTIINVEEGEADKLIELIELLIEEWYINRYERKIRLESIKKIADDKIVQKKSTEKKANSTIKTSKV